jgi:hypothetical protein
MIRAFDSARAAGALPKSASMQSIAKARQTCAESGRTAQIDVIDTLLRAYPGRSVGALGPPSHHVCRADRQMAARKYIGKFVSGSEN